MLPSRSSAVSRDFSTRAVTVGNTSCGASAPPGQTSSAASSVQLPANTASRRRQICSCSLSSSWLHSMAACSVRCRGSPPRLAPASSRNRSSSRAASCPVPRAFSRAAASSRASGMPSSRRQISLTSATLPSVSVNPGRARPARSQNSRTASAAPTAARSSSPGGGRASGGTGQVASPLTPSRLWLVAMMRIPGQPRSSALARSATASSTCSQLSSTSSSSRSTAQAMIASVSVRPGCSRTPSVVAVSGSTSSGPVSWASSTSQTPSG